MKDFDPDDVSAKLRTWKVQPQVPGSFQREVWQRIARPTARAEAFGPNLVQWLCTRLVRPQYATGLFAISLAVGLGVAHVLAQGANARQWRALEARYAMSVDPMAMMSR